MLAESVLREYYIEQQMTGAEIARLASVSVGTVYNWLEHYGIPRRTRREAQRPAKPSKATLEELYLEQELSIDEIQRVLGSSESSISRLLDEYEIPKRARWTKMAGWNKGQPLSQAQREHLREAAKQRIGKRSSRYKAVLTEAIKAKIANTLKGRFRGPDNPQWRGGRKYERDQWLSRFEYKDWRAAVFQRDNYTCQMCNKPSTGDIEAHHIYPWRAFPSLRFAVANGITLCQKCHLSIRGAEMSFAQQFAVLTHLPTP